MAQSAAVFTDNHIHTNQIYRCIVHTNHGAKIVPQNTSVPHENKAGFDQIFKVFCPFKSVNVLPAKSNIPTRMIPINAALATEPEVLRWRQFGMAGLWHAHTVTDRLCTLVSCCLSATSSNKSYSPEKTVFSLTKLTKYPASSESRGKLVRFHGVLCKFKVNFLYFCSKMTNKMTNLVI